MSGELPVCSIVASASWTNNPRGTILPRLGRSCSFNTGATQLTLNPPQLDALTALLAALQRATECNLLSTIAEAVGHPDRINAFCDDVAAFERMGHAQQQASAAGRALELAYPFGYRSIDNAP